MRQLIFPNNRGGYTRFLLAFLSVLFTTITNYAQTNVQFEEIYSFVSPPRHPFSLAASSDGNIYGTSIFGGSNGLARIFKITPDGTLSTVVTFPAATERYPLNLIEGGDGKLYGTTLLGGSSQSSTVFQATRDGEFQTIGETYIDDFPAMIRGTDGAIYLLRPSRIDRIDTTGTMSPYQEYEMTISFSSMLMQDAAGNFFNFSTYTASNSIYDGMLFKTTPGGDVTKEFTFDGDVSGSSPQNALMLNDGSMFVQAYGPTSINTMVIGKITPDYQWSILLTNAPSVSQWILGNDGNVYGITSANTYNLPQQLFSITPAGYFTTLHIFTNDVRSMNLYGSSDHDKVIAQGANGHLYCAFMQNPDAPEGVVMEFTTTGQLVRTVSLGSSSLFYGQMTGVDVEGPLHLASNGFLYGTTSAGSTNLFGTIFRISPEGVVSNLVSLNYEQQMPVTSPIQGKDGYLYGGGRNLLRVGANGSITSHSFFSPNTNPYPSFKLVYTTTPYVADAEGNLYGAKRGYYFLEENDETLPAIFRITEGGGFSNLHVFTNKSLIVTTLVAGDNGDIYGIASTNNYYYPFATNWGTFFKVDRAGHYTELSTMTQSTSELIRGKDGHFYATQRSPWYYFVERFSVSATFPRAIRIDTNGVVTELAIFTRNTGYQARGPLLQANDGNFYGTTDSGGAFEAGGIFRLTPTGELTNLWSFPSPDFSYSDSGLAQGADGKLYGFAPAGGLAVNGSIYRLDVGLPPLMTNLLTSIPAGTYNGTLRKQVGKRQPVVGYFTFRLAADGKYQGRVLLNGLICPFNGTFDETYQSIVTAKKRGKPLILNFNLSKGANAVEVHGSADLDTWHAMIVGRKANR